MSLTPIFTVPVWQTKVPDFSIDVDYLKKLSQDSETNSLDLLSDEKLEFLFQFIKEVTSHAADELNFLSRNIFITSTSLYNQKGSSSFLAEQCYSDTFTGIFYVKCLNGSGKLCLKNTSINPLWSGFHLIHDKNQYTSKSIKVDPIENNLLFWPGYLPFSIEPNQHDEETIFILFNVTMITKDALKLE